MDWKQQHPGRYSGRVDSGMRNKLEEMFTQANCGLREIAGEEFDWTSVGWK